jgi:hypothetical protein
MSNGDLFSTREFNASSFFFELLLDFSSVVFSFFYISTFLFLFSALYLCTLLCLFNFLFFEPIEMISARLIFGIFFFFFGFLFLLSVFKRAGEPAFEG